MNARFVALIAAVAALAVPAAVYPSATAPLSVKKPCKVVTKKVRGKQKKVRVCTKEKPRVQNPLFDDLPPHVPGDHAAVVSALRARGITLGEPQTATTTLLGESMPVYRYAVPGGGLHIFEFADETRAQAAAARVSRDGYNIVAPGGGIVTHVDWIALPSWFRGGRAIVLYVGTDASMRSTLRALLGPPFGGMG